MSESFSFESNLAPTMTQIVAGLIEELDRNTEESVSFTYGESTFYVQSNNLVLPEGSILITHHIHDDGRDFIVFSLEDDERVGS